MKTIQPIDWSFRIHTDLWSFRLEQTEGERSFLRTRDSEVVLFCPSCRMSSDADFQRWLRSVIRAVLRRQARQIFPSRLHAWAERTGLTYQRLAIHSTRSRWGSYSGRGNLNLSLYLMLLDSVYVDYTMCHELCHSREMNHGPRFWALLNDVLHTDARRRGQEMNDRVRDWYEAGDARYLLLSNQ